MKHILLINGDFDTRDILRMVLEHHGYRVTDAATSDAALELARREPPDLVILELYLHPMDGQEFMQRLRRDVLTTRVPIICLTSRVMESDRQAAMTAGADVFLPKPLTPSQVVEQVRGLIDSVPA